jgi:hypothetical protein
MPSGSETHLALRFLRERARLTRADVRRLAALQHASVSEQYLAQCETDPAKAANPRSAREPSVDKLGAILSAVGSSPEEWEQLLRKRPWAGGARQSAGGPVSEGDEWAQPDPTLAADLAALHRALPRATEQERATLRALTGVILSRQG